ncbi:2-dehydro-3-deoxygalactonokinase [Salinihabitans flavidus]|uniref:2-dehydro-3-deoxygalactonokinase n=1 Tax=Salinihabitans flavidus TaxID=569882 RepID=A0A1H8LF05_9RHOB|nr:2-dehydro-3-deoxygalactonokinase [Salinihabitans flavidus]SEO03741.1 2-dehydro-3-deoxygalactonokinase [Salinihabitans flavidus]
MSDWIAAERGANGLHGWRMPDGFTAQAADMKGITAKLGNGLPVVMIGEGERTLPAPVIAPPVKTGDHWAIKGLRQATPEDRLGAEIAILAGLVAPRPRWDGVVCITGARSVWAHVSAGEVISFRSFVSGILAGALSAGDPVGGAGFDTALEEVVTRPERLASLLGQGGAARIWGALIGAEIAATKPYWLGQQVLLAGPNPYAGALRDQGVPVEIFDKESMRLEGLKAIWTTRE